MPTVPLVETQSAIVSTTAGVGRIDRLDQPEPAGMGRVDLYGVAGVVAVHAERRDQYRAVDADGVHGRHHLVAGNLGRAVEGADPRPARVVALVGVNLGV